MDCVTLLRVIDTVASETLGVICTEQSQVRVTFCDSLLTTIFSVCDTILLRVIVQVTVVPKATEILLPCWV